VPEAAKARGRKGADSQKQNLKVRGVHSVFTAQRYQKWDRLERIFMMGQVL
jgi:uncharacterized metal-binding protein